jgi:large subunit ribosomal protein L18
MSIFRSNKQISAQIIDDNTQTTLVSASSLHKDIAAKTDINKSQQAELVGQLIAEKAKSANIEIVVFDRNGYLYHGRVKSLAEAARKAGLKL